MPKWIEVTADYDHRWPSGAVTALKAGTIVNVKDEVADDAIRLKAAKASSKPEAGDKRHETSGAAMDTDRRAMTETRHVVSGGFRGHPDRETRAAIALAEERRAVADKSRSEDMEQTARDAEATAATLRLEQEAAEKAADDAAKATAKK